MSVQARRGSTPDRRGDAPRPRVARRPHVALSLALSTGCTSYTGSSARDAGVDALVDRARVDDAAVDAADSPDAMDTHDDVKPPRDGALPATLRPLAPLSTMTVSSRRPTLRWALPEGATGARVELCHDRACDRPLTRVDVTGTDWTSPEDLPRGAIFWRLRGRDGPDGGAEPSATWQFFVGAGAEGAGVTYGPALDLNGDGLADLVFGANNADRAHIYLARSTGFEARPSITLAGPDSGYFGHNVAAAGDVNGDGYGDLLVSAVNAQGMFGRAYLYLGSAGGVLVVPAATLSSSDGGQFGTSMAGVGDVNGDGYGDVLIGAPYAMSNRGRAHLFLGGPTGPSSRPSASALSPDPQGYFGVSVAGPGDVNGDGFADLLVGAPNALGTGRMHLYLGGADALAAPPALSVTGPDGPRSAFGWAVSGAGDINGDGFADFAVGAYSIDRAYVFHGGAVLSSAASAVLTGPSESSFGVSFGSGDVNGDGYTDLAVAASRASDAAGAVSLYLGSRAGASLHPAVTLTGTDALGLFGFATACPGDVNGDGYADLVVGAFQSGAGHGYVFLGGMAGLSTTAFVRLTGPDRGGQFGWSVASAWRVRTAGRRSLACASGSRLSS